MCEIEREREERPTPFIKSLFYTNSYTDCVQYGILIGIGISLLLLLYPMARPKLRVSSSQSE